MSDRGAGKRFGRVVLAWYASAAALGMIAYLACGVSGVAQVGTANIDLSPGCPATDNEVVLFIWGTWPAICVPRLLEVQITGKHIVVATKSLATGCTHKLTQWIVAVPLGRLPPGEYAVTITHRRAGLPYEMPEEVIGRTTFRVRISGCASTDPLPEVSPADLKVLV